MRSSGFADAAEAEVFEGKAHAALADGRCADFKVLYNASTCAMPGFLVSRLAIFSNVFIGTPLRSARPMISCRGILSSSART